MKRRFFLLGATVAPFGFSGPVWAKTAQLRLDGDFHSRVPLYLTEADLLDFPQINIETSTIWTEGVSTFSGPALSDVLAHYGAKSGDVELGGTNNYSAVVARSLVTAQAPIIANRIDGLPFSLREKGPLWIIFPYDRSPEFQSEVVYAASVWQLTSIRVLKD